MPSRHRFRIPDLSNKLSLGDHDIERSTISPRLKWKFLSLSSHILLQVPTTWPNLLASFLGWWPVANSVRSMITAAPPFERRGGSEGWQVRPLVTLLPAQPVELLAVWPH